MALSQPFYNGIIRRYVIAFGSLFSGIYITRENSSGEVIQTLEVPLSYAPKDKVISRIDQNPNLDKQVAITLPRISFELVDIEFDATRKGQTLNQLTAYSTDLDKLKTVYSPIPYNLRFEVNVFVRNAEDGLKIVEQIIPFFRPHKNIDVKVIPSMNIIRDVPITFNNLNINDSYEGDFQTRRAIIWTLQFTMKADLFGPIDDGKSIIKRVDGNILQPTGDPNAIRTTVTVTPGLLANGSPTSNSSASIPTSQISANSNFGISSDITVFV